MSDKQHYRTVWLSDIHLGCKDCKAEFLLDFLDNTKIDTLFLVGDIVDLWALSRQFHWPPLHNQLFHTLLRLPEQGTRVIYLPGNHDEPAQQYDAMRFGDIEIHRQYIHTTATGKKLLLLHGDQFDKEVCFGRTQAWIGDKAYDLLLFVNRWYNFYAQNKATPTALLPLILSHASVGRPTPSDASVTRRYDVQKPRALTALSAGTFIIQKSSLMTESPITMMAIG